MTLRTPSPVERIARIDDAATARALRIEQHEGDSVFVGVEWLSAGLMHVRRGAKHIRVDGGDTIEVGADDYVWMSPGTRVDVRNVTDVDGDYLAEGLMVAPELLVELDAAERVPSSSSPPARVRRIGPTELPELVEAHRRCLEALNGGYPDGVVRARVLELVAWVQTLNVDLGASSSARLVVKRLVSRDPSHAWTLTEVARAVAMSEDTLHRRLTSEATSFSRVLVDVRMDRAVSLLWTTDLPVGHVALEAGYSSPSRFATRFFERFGILPSKLRETRQASRRRA